MKQVLEYIEELRRRPYLTVLTGLLVSSLFLTLFSKIVWETFYENDLHGFDSAVSLQIRHFATPSLDKLMLTVTELGSGTIMFALALSVLLIFLARGWRREAIALLICMVGAGLLNQLLKVLFSRARPDMFRLVDEAGYSFPSGHAMVSFCVYGFLAYVLSRQFQSIRMRGTMFFVALCIVTSIGISRIYLGVHFPTDVLAGFVAGGMWLGFCLSWLHWREYRSGR